MSFRNRVCDHCAHYHQTAPATAPGKNRPASSVGECREKSPRVVKASKYAGEVYTVTRWPTVSGAQYCGQFKGRMPVEPASESSGLFE